MNRTVRSAGPEDAAAIARLTGQLGYVAGESQIRQRLAAIAKNAQHCVYVAEAAGAGIVGWIHVHSVLSLVSGAFAEIGALVVDEAQRGKGVGAQLTRAAEHWARQREHSTIRVRTNVVRERARKFYRRLGYAPEKHQQVFSKRLDAGDRVVV